jgi:hypothetical protein
MAAKFHLTENAFALQLLFQRPYGALYAYISSRTLQRTHHFQRPCWL